MPSLRTQKQIMAALVVLLCLVFAPAFLYSVQGANGSSPVSPAANASDAPLARGAEDIAPLPPVRLSVSGAEQAVELRALQIESDISGRLAQTTV
ncbi:MAG: hypothetical protein LBS89_08675, partial [Zoogloeaceae bacterium]|nr:hypothetical protein [Zoogloeaceae bacterium]